MIKRLDPKGCGCTDCLTGYSTPINDYTPLNVITSMLYGGYVLNATGYAVSDFLAIDYDGKIQAVVLPWKVADFKAALAQFAVTS